MGDEEKGKKDFEEGLEHKREELRREEELKNRKANPR